MATEDKNKGFAAAAFKVFNESGISDSQLRRLEEKYFKEQTEFDSSKATHKIERKLKNYIADIEHEINVEFAVMESTMREGMKELEDTYKKGNITKEEFDAAMQAFQEEMRNLSEEKRQRIEQSDPRNDNINAVYLQTLQEVAQNVNTMTRNELKANLERMKELMEIISEAGGEHSEFMTEQYAKTIAFMEKEFHRRSELMTRAVSKVSELADQYLDLQSLYSGFVNHNPLAMFMFKMGSDFIKNWRDKKKIERELMQKDLHRLEMAKVIEEDKKKDLELQKQREDELAALEEESIKESFDTDSIQEAFREGVAEGVESELDKVFGGAFKFPEDEYSGTGDAPLDEDLISQIMGVTGGEAAPIFERMMDNEESVSESTAGPVETAESLAEEKFERIASRREDRMEQEIQAETEQYREELLGKMDDIIDLLEVQNKLFGGGGPLSGKGGGIAGAAAGGVLDSAGELGASYLLGKYGGKILKGAKSFGKSLLGGAGKLLAVGSGLATGAASLLTGGASEKATKKAAEKVAQAASSMKGTFSKVGEATSKASKAVTKKAAGKVAGKSLGKSLLKKIPGVGLVMGLGFGLSRLFEGDFSGAAMEVASGAASTIPGLGTAASVGIDAALAAKDMGAFEDEEKQEPVKSTKPVTKGEIRAIKKKAETLSRNNEVSMGLRSDIPEKRLLNVIARGEGTSDEVARSKGYESGYDVTLGYGKYDPEGFDKPLSQMTLAEVKEFQRGMLKNPKNVWRSSAVGKYQIISGTLRELQEELGLSDDTVFSPEVQDMMGKKLLEHRGLNKFKTGKIDAKQFQDNLAKEWASIATASTGRSYYGQHTGTSSAVIQTALNDIKSKEDLVLASGGRISSLEVPMSRRSAENMQNLEYGISAYNEAKEAKSMAVAMTPQKPQKQMLNTQTSPGTPSIIESARNPDSTLQRITDRYMAGAFA